jgi:hypothetical protein
LMDSREGLEGPNADEAREGRNFNTGKEALLPM